MSTNPGIPDHFTIHDIRDAAEGSPPAVRDIREAMHPADDLTPEDAAAFTRQQERLDAFDRGAPGPHPPRYEPPSPTWTKLDDGRTSLPLGFFDDVPFAYEFTDANGPMRCHPASGVGPLTLHVKRPHVATLPDGARVNLPAGTVLREGMTWEDMPSDPLRDLCTLFKTEPSAGLAAMILKLREQVDRGALPLLERARDLLHGARIRLVDEPDSKRLAAAIVAFLAGDAPPEGSEKITAEGSLAAMVRAFVAWNRDGGPDQHDEAMGTLFALGDVMTSRGLLKDCDGDPTPAGEALLARASSPK